MSREMKVESETVSRQRKDPSERVRSIIVEANPTYPPPELHQCKRARGVIGEANRRGAGKRKWKGRR